MRADSEAETHAAAEALVLEVAGEMGAMVHELTANLHERLTEEIADLRGDQQLLDLLAASIESNLAALVSIIRLRLAGSADVQPAGRG